MEDGVKLLIVDDLEDNRVVLKKVLRKIKHVKLFEAEDGDIAVDFVKANRPEIVIMDIMMPNKNGIDATKEIKELYPETIVVVVTALQDANLESKLISVGATAYIRKPFDREIIQLKIQNLVDLVMSQKNSYQFQSKKSSINPFSTDIRSMQIYYHINNIEDMMDFGLWLLDYYHSKATSGTFKFNIILEFLYTILKTVINSKHNSIVVIEEGTSEIYINLQTLKESNLSLSIEKFSSELGEDMLIKGDFIHLKVSFEDLTLKTKKEVRKLENIEVDVLRKSYSEKIDAISFAKTVEGYIIDEIDDLKDIEADWDNAVLDFEKEHNFSNLKKLSNLIYQYSTVINNMYEFASLAYAISSLSVFLNNTKEEIIQDKTNSKKIVVLLNAVMHDLIEWRKTVFEYKEAKDIHYLDSSLFSSCLQIELILNK